MTARDTPKTSDAETSEKRSAAATLLPWGVSFVVHMGLVLLTIFVVWSTTTFDDEDTVVPIASLEVTPPSPMKMQPTQNMKNAMKSAKSAVQRQNKPVPMPTQKVSAASTLIGAVGSAVMKPDPFGMKSGTQQSVSMYGSKGSARRVVYLIDASGSLIDSLPFVMRELQRSILELSEKQLFTVIFFQGVEAIEVPPNGMKRADSGNKRRVIDWINLDSGNIAPMGRSNPINALKVALRYKPELLFLLSDNITGQGQFEVLQEDLLAEIKAANQGRAKINTIQFLYPDPLERFGLTPTLQLISERTGGMYKFVDGYELGIE